MAELNAASTIAVLLVLLVNARTHPVKFTQQSHYGNPIDFRKDIDADGRKILNEEYYFSMQPEDNELFRKIISTDKLQQDTPHVQCAKSQNKSRRKRYVPNKYKWLFTDISWQFTDPHSLFKRPKDFRIVRNTIAHALDMWSRASGRVLNFTEKFDNQTKVDLKIYFARGDHGDSEPFDGRGGIVAHSGYPMDGNVHFDASELWTIKGRHGIDIRYVRSGLVVYNRPVPRCRNTPKELALSDDDINGVRFLYGKKLLKKDAIKAMKRLNKD